MSPEERQLIAGLFDRMRGFALGEKDKEADALINEQMVSVRDAPYMLVQSVLVQEQALQQADARIRELENEVQTLQSSAQQRPAASGGFLGGVFGSRPAAEPPRGASVPTVGARATPPAYGSRASQQGPQGWTGPQAAGAQPTGGGFLQSAMSTAAGVAGGMLVAGAIGNLLGGGSSASAATPSSEPQAASGNDSGTTEAAPQQSADTGSDTSAQDTADEDGGWFGGDWFGGDSGGDSGGDFEL